MSRKPLYVWAEEGGIELKLSPHPEFAHQAVIEIVTRGRDGETVHAKATMASFRHRRIAEWLATPTETKPTEAK